MKLQNKVFGTIFGVIASSLVFISVPVSAQAGECTTADPCMTYAVVDSSNTVVNIIVCQPSVCGSGVWDGKKVVPQVAANPQTNDTFNTGGKTTSGNHVVTVSEDNVFTVQNNGIVVESFSAPIVENTKCRKSVRE
jgi:hypothetical protein